MIDRVFNYYCKQLIIRKSEHQSDALEILISVLDKMDDVAKERALDSSMSADDIVRGEADRLQVDPTVLMRIVQDVRKIEADINKFVEDLNNGRFNEMEDPG